MNLKIISVQYYFGTVIFAGLWSKRFANYWSL